MYRDFQCQPQGSDNAHGRLVAAIAAALQPSLYVELGCFRGDTFEMVEPYCAKAVAVDHADYSMFFEPRGLASNFVHMDTLAYLATLEDSSVELCFLDSSHKEEATIHEFEALTPKMVKNGVVLFHDSYPPNEEYTQDGKCGGVWRAIEHLRKTSAYFEFATLPFQYGLTIARKSFGKQLLWK
jgi:Predicted O-methyltransferase